VSGNLKRGLESGGSLSFNANLNREDATTTFSPSLPNPSLSSSVDVSYRHPLAKGANNPEYAQAKDIADANKMISYADQQSRHDQLASRIIELYISAITTHVYQKIKICYRSKPSSVVSRQNFRACRFSGNSNASH